MKHHHGLATIGVCVLALLFITGCGGVQTIKDPIGTSAYQSLSTMNTAYDLAWGGFVQLYKDGLVKEETFQAGRTLANKYFDVWTKAAKALRDYKAGTVPGNEVEALKALAEMALSELKSYLKEKSGGIKPII